MSERGMSHERRKGEEEGRRGEKGGRAKNVKFSPQFYRVSIEAHTRGIEGLTGRGAVESLESS